MAPAEPEHREPEHRGLTAGQLGVWYGQGLSADPSVYSISEYVELLGDLDLADFDAALRYAVGEADACRLRFTGDGPTLRQHVGSGEDWAPYIADLTGVDDARAVADAWMRADLRQPVDLRHGPL
ncbi:MAG: condensation domain-containing protein, partial [Streptosporangiaceae bacterium]